MRSRILSVVARYGGALLILGAIIGVQSLLLFYSIKISFTVPIIVGVVATAWYGGFGPGLVIAILIAGISAISDRGVVVDETTIQWATRHASNFGLLLFIVGVIAERRQVSGKMNASEEQARRKSEEQFRLFFELGNAGMAIISPDKKFVEVNQEICKLLGYTPDELRSMVWTDIPHPDDQAPEHFERILTGKSDAYSLEKRVVKKDGAILYANISMKAVREADGSLTNVIA
ncbi:MAG TPA: PAS domain S-box protein, partial [Pyrinomonadaceae bacterium]